MDNRIGGRGAGAAHGLRVPGVVAVLAVLGGCALGPDFQPPAPPAGEHVLADAAGAATAPALTADGATQRFARDADLPGAWWQGFGSADVDALVAQALAHSPGLVAAQATLRQSQDSLRAGYGVFFPQLGASVGVARQSELVNLGKGMQSTHPYNLGTFGANVAYVPDLFGGQRRAVEALGAHVDLQRYEVLASYLSLTSNVVNTAIARAGYAAQRAALLDIVRVQDEQLRLARLQFDAGVAPYAAVLGVQAQQAGNAAALAALEQRLDQSAHLLAQLCGQAPADFAAPAVALEQLALPAQLPDTVPAMLARHRPDILAAQAQLHEASAQIGVGHGRPLSQSEPGWHCRGGQQHDRRVPAQRHALLVRAGHSGRIRVQWRQPVVYAQGGARCLRCGAGAVSADRAARPRAGGRHDARARA